MGNLQVILLGNVRVTHNNWRNDIRLTREIQTLLAYLLLKRQRSHPREVLAGIFWAEQSQEKARRALNTALWRLKKILEPEGIPAGTYLISSHPGEVAFNCESQYWLDVEIFEKQINNIIALPSDTVDDSKIRGLEKIIDLYRGDLLEGVYDEWALRERERIRDLYLKSLEYLMQYYKFNKLYDKAGTYGQQILNLDPIREDVHREIMRLYLESGQRALAARQYAVCKLALIKELGVQPMEETQMLYAQISTEAHQGRTPLPGEETINVELAFRQLREVSNTLELAREQVEQTLRFFTQYTGMEG
jgi:DNA-binding SARP family transcriptional activator